MFIYIWFSLFGFGYQIFGSNLTFGSGIVGFGVLDSDRDLVLRKTQRKQTEIGKRTREWNSFRIQGRLGAFLCNARICTKSSKAFPPSDAGDYIGFIVARLVAVVGTGSRMGN